MAEKYTSNIRLAQFKPLLENQKKRNLLSITLEITARCNNNCKHCYLNLPENDDKAIKIEMSYHEITRIIDEAISLGALWCTFTGGEPLLRDDFSDLYLYAKENGLLTSVLTNATLITDEHVDLFKKYPPRNLEISVYGVSKKTYEHISGIKGSFKNFEYGIIQLIENKIPISLKAPALKSNYEEYKAIIDFCKKHSREGYVRFDPLLFLRTDNDKARNRLISTQRLSPEKLKNLKKLYFASDTGFDPLGKECAQNQPVTNKKDHFTCNAGNISCKIGYDAYVSPCALCYHPECRYNLRKGSLTDAWNSFIPKVIGKYLQNVKYPEKCYDCDKIGNCLWCPALAYLEHGRTNKEPDYICSLIKHF
ncbi:MAG: hypothetical protein DRH26_14835 [Deltaproteobacteria bacterium]|nr:MAG: hypothetical protein DRH26_14835 [Deltaproteobacteria bacterium]